MKIILSPAKKMITDTDSIAPDGLPEFIEKIGKHGSLSFTYPSCLII